MKKLAIFLCALAVIGVAVVDTAEAANVARGVWSGQALWGVNTSCRGAEGGHQVWMTYWIERSGNLETNRDDAGFIGNGTKHPHANNAPSDGDDLGGFWQNASGLNAQMDAQLYSDNAAFIPNIGDNLVFASAMTCSNGQCSSAGGGDCYDTAQTAAATDATYHYTYGVGTVAVDVNITAAIYAFGNLDPNTRVVSHPVGGGSTQVSLSGKLGTPNWVRLRFDGSIIPAPLPDAGPTEFSAVGDPLGNAKYGARVYRSTLDPTVSVPADYATALTGDGTQTARFDGSTADMSEWGPGAADLYFNDYAVDLVVSPNTHYVTGPVLPPDALNPNGIGLYAHGSWLQPGLKSGPSGGLPTPATVVSFDGSFDPKTGKVTLNWRSDSEDNLQGYNVWRKMTLNGRDLGRKQLVQFVQAQGPGVYTIEDTPDLRRYSRLARGRPIDVIYELEVVNMDGTSTMEKETSMRLSTRTARRAR
jgi:hypothetical protein